MKDIKSISSTTLNNINSGHTSDTKSLSKTTKSVLTTDFSNWFVEALQKELESLDDDDEETVHSSQNTAQLNNNKNSSYEFLNVLDSYDNDVDRNKNTIVLKLPDTCVYLSSLYTGINAIQSLIIIYNQLLDLFGLSKVS
jgi:hypothetical protein